MGMTMGNVVYWHKNQVIIRARTKAPQPAHQASQSANNAQAGFTIDEIISLISRSTHAGLIPGLMPFDTIPPRPTTPSAGAATAVTVDDCLLFYRVSPDTQSAMGTMQGSDGTVAMDSVDATLSTIEKFSTDPVLKNGAEQLGCSLDFMPHWFWTGTDDQSHGCPLSPPIPRGDSGEAGQWTISFQKLADPSLQEKTGKGVMVFVLDTLPSQHQIERAAKNNSRNTLLQRMTAGLTNGSQPNVLPPAIKLNYSYDADIPAPSESATTGKDIYGRLVGFPMADHGTAIAGIIRDLAPDAEIECIRVLNNYGVGDIRTLAKVLTDIKKRMDDGDIASKPVVINLSLVVLPPGNGMPDGVTEDILKSTRDTLYTHLQALADGGAVLTASSGNDSDPRDAYMNSAEVHFGSRYPAALAYDDPPVTTMIPVGAVNQKGEAAIYSNHPGYLGIATYAGELPRPDPWVPSAMSHAVTRVVEPIDALCCVYTSQFYPALSVNDHHAILPESSSEYPMYEASSSWACWSGTSFATPIISALAARILQGQDPGSIDVRQAVLNAATQETTWSRVGDAREDISGALIMATQAWQPASDAMHA